MKIPEKKNVGRSRRSLPKSSPGAQFFIDWTMWHRKKSFAEVHMYIIFKGDGGWGGGGDYAIHLILVRYGENMDL